MDGDYAWRKFGWGLCNNLGHIATKDATISDENYYFGISMEEITTVSCGCKYVLHDDREGWEEVNYNMMQPTATFRL